MKINAINTSISSFPKLPLFKNRTAVSFCGDFNVKYDNGDEFVKIDCDSIDDAKPCNNDELSFHEFVKWAKENDFIDNLKKRKDGLIKLIGSGFEGKTYHIEGCDNWILKIYDRGSYARRQLEKPEIIETGDILPELNVGQNIALIDIPLNSDFSERFHVLKKQYGKSSGIEYNDSENIDESTISQHFKFLKKLVSSSEKLYDNLIDDITAVSKAGYEFDCYNPWNFMFDENEGKITFVDINDKKNDDSMQYERVLFGLLDAYFHFNYQKSDVSSEDKKYEIELISKIYEKYTAAMKRKGAKFDDNYFTEMISKAGISESILPGKTPEEKKQSLIKQGLL